MQGWAGQTIGKRPRDSPQTGRGLRTSYSGCFTLPCPCLGQGSVACGGFDGFHG